MKIGITLALLAAIVCRAAEPVAFDADALASGIAQAIHAAKRPLPASAPPARQTFVAYPPALYAPDTYTSFTVGLTRGGFRLAKSGTDLRFHVTGRSRPAGIGGPGQLAELPGSAYEVVLNFEIYSSEARTSKISGPHQVRWNGKRLLTVQAGTDYASDPWVGPYVDGQWCEYWSVVSRLPSVGKTLAGEPGQLATIAPSWPRTEGVGGWSGVYGIYGTKFTSATDIASLEPWVAAMDAGSFAPPGASSWANVGGFSPIAVTGTTTGGGRKAFIIASDSLERSHDFPHRSRVQSGAGYFYSANGGQHGAMSWALSGSKVSDLLTPALVSGRWPYTRFADGVLVGLGSNDLKDGTVEQLEANLRSLIAAFRAAGIHYFAVETILARWASNDGYRTFSGQLPALPGFNERAAAWNARLPGLLAEGLIHRVIDRRPWVQDESQGWKWKLPALAGSYGATAGSSGGTVKLSGITLEADIHAGRRGYFPPSYVPWFCFGNSVAGGTPQLNLQLPGGYQPGDIPAGTPVEIWDEVTDDGVHQGPYGHYLMSQAYPMQALAE